MKLDFSANQTCQDAHQYFIPRLLDVKSKKSELLYQDYKDHFLAVLTQSKANKLIASINELKESFSDDVLIELYVRSIPPRAWARFKSSQRQKRYKTRQSVKPTELTYSAQISLENIMKSPKMQSLDKKLSIEVALWFTDMCLNSAEIEPRINDYMERTLDLVIKGTSSK